MQKEQKIVKVRENVTNYQTNEQMNEHSKVPLEKKTVTQSAKKFSTFCEPEGSLVC
jgi:hypothetical protein